MADYMKFSRRSFLLMTAALAACKPGSSILELSGQTMGTTYNLVGVDHGGTVDRDELRKAVEASLAEVNDQMSNWDRGSEISRFNATTSQATPVSPALAQVIKAAQDVHSASDGRFDITVGPLVDAWGFGSGRDRSDAPSDAEIATALSLSGQERTLAFENGRLRKLEPGVELNLAAIGKGYGVDRVAASIESFGVSDYMIEIGGDLYTSGKNPDGQNWRIGIETPDRTGRSVLQVVETSGLGMATSGDYRNYFEQDGQRYSHVIDPKTGRPITHATTSATVLTENAMLADAWATAMLVLGSERGLEIADEQGLAVLFVDADGAEKPYVIKPSKTFAALQA
ncbi:FAD:protein FMN transferase [Flavimaribacter sediminis]|nr:FAD:protein FMN transferase [Flavimaribacter sediminis]